MLTSLLLLLGLSSPAFADEEAAETCLQTKVWDGYNDGWGVRTITSTTIPGRKTKNFLVSLYADTEYKVLTCADKNAADLDVLVYDDQGNLLTRDPERGREPQLVFKVKKTGTYYLVLYMRETAKQKPEASAALALVYK